MIQSLGQHATQRTLTAKIDWAGRPVHIEYQWIEEAKAETDTPWLIFLHEGLGSISMWRDFPQTLCSALGCRGLVYSRPGYGQSTPRATGEVWEPDFMHRQAYEVLPALLLALGLDTAANPPCLLGHSDGGSIALLYAARFPDQVAGTVVLAPHIMVEDLAVSSIATARTAYLETDLRQRLARHHNDPDSAFWGWNTVWLNPAFRRWTIEADIAAITCPLLAVQGLDDEYGTLAQIRGIATSIPQTELLELAECGHSPHRDQPAQLISRIEEFFKDHAY